MQSRRSTSLLNQHPINEEIYKDDIDEDFLNDIKKNGILQPIIITGKESDIGENVIISGHRRFKAAIKLNLKDVPVIISGLKLAIDIEEAVISANKQRKKTTEQETREFQKMLEIESKRAEEIRNSKLKQNGGCTVKEIFPYHTHSESKGQARDAASKKIGATKTGRTLEKAVKVINAIDEKVKDGMLEEAKELKETLNKSVDKAYNIVKPEIEIKKQVIAAIKGDCKFNMEKIDDKERIEWSKWTWNPVTGCKHGCKYCYARDIANRYSKEKSFEPKFYPERLCAPENTKIPEKMNGLIGRNNVFVCSMADLFGDWVDNTWINLVLAQTEKFKQWNYLFLTKNPKRYKEFIFGSNCWIGATVDTKARAKPSLEALKEAKAISKTALTFLSCEPLMDNAFEDVKASELKYIDWIIIGGRSQSSGMASGQPKWEWVENILIKARENKIKIYFKPNLEVRPKEYPNN